MAIYSVGRKRIIIALLLTSALLLTLDLRGNPVIDRGRDVFAVVISPIESATEVVTNPLEQVWNGIVHYDDLEEENLALQDQVDRLIGTQAAAEAAVIEGKELQALYSLPSLSGIDTEVARVVGSAANNLDQVIEINKGSSSGIAVGMPVVNQAGLVGKITSVTRTTARVMLVTDSRYVVSVKVTSSDGSFQPPADTTPSGLAPDEIADAATTTTVPPDTTEPGESELPVPIPDTTLPGATPPPLPDGFEPLVDDNGDPLSEEDLAALADQLDADAAADPDDPADPDDAADPVSTSTSTTTTTTIPVIEKEFGGLEGRGRLLLPQIRFLQDNPSLAVLQEGDLVETAGDSESLAPAGIPVGRVANRADRPGSGGPRLDVELHADLSRLNFVRVVLYRPLSEVEQ
jgi:rod shape-determining protein MreC